jgi:hypothetical protein
VLLQPHCKEHERRETFELESMLKGILARGSEPEVYTSNTSTPTQGLNGCGQAMQMARSQPASAELVRTNGVCGVRLLAVCVFGALKSQFQAPRKSEAGPERGKIDPSCVREAHLHPVVPAWQLLGQGATLPGEVHLQKFVSSILCGTPTAKRRTVKLLCARQRSQSALIDDSSLGSWRRPLIIKHRAWLDHPSLQPPRHRPLRTPRGASRQTMGQHTQRNLPLEAAQTVWQVGACRNGTPTVKVRPYGWPSYP